MMWRCFRSARPFEWPNRNRKKSLELLTRLDLLRKKLDKIFSASFQTSHIRVRKSKTRVINLWNFKKVECFDRHRKSFWELEALGKESN